MEAAATKMIAIDTNILIRFVVNDDPDQFRRAKAFLAGNDVVLLTTVVLECEWVLRSGYDYSREQIGAALVGLFGLPRVTLQDRTTLLWALHGYQNGMEFSDALHLAGASQAAAFATFDADLKRRAAKLDVFVPVIAP
jgi:predicted nucleic-acid-binding protein